MVFGVTLDVGLLLWIVISAAKTLAACYPVLQCCCYQCIYRTPSVLYFSVPASLISTVTVLCAFVRRMLITGSRPIRRHAQATAKGIKNPPGDHRHGAVPRWKKNGSDETHRLAEPERIPEESQRTRRDSDASLQSRTSGNLQKLICRWKLENSPCIGSGQVLPDGDLRFVAACPPTVVSRLKTRLGVQSRYGDTSPSVIKVRRIFWSRHCLRLSSRRCRRWIACPDLVKSAAWALSTNGAECRRCPLLVDFATRSPKIYRRGLVTASNGSLSTLNSEVVALLRPSSSLRFRHEEPENL
jgi:hypothetical protein